MRLINEVTETEAPKLLGTGYASVAFFELLPCETCTVALAVCNEKCPYEKALREEKSNYYEHKRRMREYARQKRRRDATTSID